MCRLQTIVLHGEKGLEISSRPFGILFFFFVVVVCFVLTGCVNSFHIYIGSILLQLTIQHPTGARELDCNHIYIYTHFYFFFF